MGNVNGLTESDENYVLSVILAGTPRRNDAALGDARSLGRRMSTVL